MGACIPKEKKNPPVENPIKLRLLPVVPQRKIVPLLMTPQDSKLAQKRSNQIALSPLNTSTSHQPPASPEPLIPNNSTQLAMSETELNA